MEMKDSEKQILKSVFQEVDEHTWIKTSSLNLPEKQSILEAIEHLFARYLEIRPLFCDAARPMNEE